MPHSSDDLDHIPRTLYISGTGFVKQMGSQLVAFNNRSTTLRFEPCYVDPEPEKALSLAKKSYAMGLPASCEEATLEEALRDAPDECAPAVSAVNQPSYIERTLRSDHLGEHSLFVYTVLDLPLFEGLVAWSCLLEPVDGKFIDKLACFFGHLALLTAPSGQREVFGQDGLAANSLLEDRCYATFADHFELNLPKVFRGLDRETARAEVSLFSC